MTIENKATFRIRLASLAPSKQLDVILAYTLAKFYHRAQTRKEMVDGKPMRYFEHLRRVAITLMDDLKIKDPHMIIACLLHDVLEDSDDITPELIEHSFGSEVVSMVKCLTKTPDDNYHDRLNNCSDWRVLCIKACDRLDNLRSLMVPGTSVEFQKKQIKETEQYYFPLFDKLLLMTPPAYQSNVSFARDEIRRLIERYKTIIELKEQANA